MMRPLLAGNFIQQPPIEGQRSLRGGKPANDTIEQEADGTASQAAQVSKGKTTIRSILKRWRAKTE